jgi:hypothetical protein
MNFPFIHLIHQGGANRDDPNRLEMAIIPAVATLCSKTKASLPTHVHRNEI